MKSTNNLEAAFTGIDIKPCPCCGSTDLHAGPRSMMSYGIQCYKCELKLELPIPCKWPRLVRVKGKDRDYNMKRLSAHILLKAAKLWNTRRASANEVVTIVPCLH